MCHLFLFCTRARWFLGQNLPFYLRWSSLSTQLMTLSSLPCVLFQNMTRKLALHCLDVVRFSLKLHPLFARLSCPMALKKDTLLPDPPLPGGSNSSLLGHQSCLCLMAFSASSICIWDLQGCHQVPFSHIFTNSVRWTFRPELMQTCFRQSRLFWFLKPVCVLWACWQFQLARFLPTPQFWVCSLGASKLLKKGKLLTYYW